MEICISCADPSDPVLTHEDCCVRVVEQVACQVRKLGDDLLGNLGVSLCGNQDAEAGRGKKHRHESPGFWRPPRPSHYQYLPRLPYVASGERVNDLHAGSAEITYVTRSNGKPVFQRGGGDHPIEEWERLTFPPQIDDQPPPPPADGGVPRKAGNGPCQRLEPLFELCPLASREKREDPDVQLAEDDGSTARCRSLARNHSTTFSLGLGLVGSLSTLASTR